MIMKLTLSPLLIFKIFGILFDSFIQITVSNLRLYLTHTLARELLFIILTIFILGSVQIAVINGMDFLSFISNTLKTYRKKNAMCMFYFFSHNS
jgi:hypothetical protein